MGFGNEQENGCRRLIRKNLFEGPALTQESGTIFMTTLRYFYYFTNQKQYEHQQDEILS